jgi:hypothetical protein
MADLEIPNVGVLSITPIGLRNDTFSGWTMRSDIGLSAGNFSMSLGEFKSAPSFRSGIWQFITESLPYYKYAPSFDDDLPSTVMDMELERFDSQVCISIGSDYYCSLDDDSTWVEEINSELLRCSKLGVDQYSVTTHRVENLLLIRSSFEAEVANEQMVDFLDQLVAELDSNAKPKRSV